MKAYILTITNSFNSDYIAEKYNSYEEALAVMEGYLELEIEKIEDLECYEPSVLRFNDNDVRLVDEEETVTLDNYREFTNSCITYYRVFKIEI